MTISRDKYIKTVKKYVGVKEGSSKHKSIIKTFNTVKPDGWLMNTSSPWCATFVSAMAIKAFGKTDAKKYFPLSANCNTIIDKAKKMGIWVENDAYTPKIGDWMLYDWDDTGKGDNTGRADHVGVVESVSNGVIIVIEGNYQDMVKRRSMAKNGRYIRGYVTPKYPTSNKTTSKKATEPAKSFAGHLAGTYKTTANLNMRTGAGSTKTRMVVIPKGSKVKMYGYYTTVSGANWYYVQFEKGKTLYTGFCHSKYLKKVTR